MVDEADTLKMKGRGALRSPEKHAQDSGPGYWKRGYDSSSALLDESERKSHVKDYGMGLHEKKARFQGKRRLRRGLAGSGGSSAKYVPRSR